MVVACLLSMSTMACRRTTRIGDIVADPRAFEGRTLSVRGEVGDTLNIVVLKAYSINDGSGTIYVVTDTAVPQRGESVGVTGKVNQAFAFGDKSLLVIHEDPR